MNIAQMAMMVLRESKRGGVSLAPLWDREQAICDATEKRIAGLEQQVRRLTDQLTRDHAE